MHFIKKWGWLVLILSVAVIARTLHLRQTQNPIVEVPPSREIAPPQPATEPVAPTDVTPETPSQSKELLLQNCNFEPASRSGTALVLEFSNSVLPNQVAQHLSITPKLDLAFALRGGWREEILVTGKFIPGEKYQITLAADLQDTRGTKLNQTIKRTYTAPDYKAFITIATPGRYLPPQGDLAIPILSCNVTQYVTRISQILPQNLVQMVMREKNRYAGYNSSHATILGKELGAHLVTTTNLIAHSQNHETQTLLALRPLLPQPRGIFALEVMHPDLAPDEMLYHARYSDDSDLGDVKLLCISDIGLSAKQSPSALTVWTTSLTQGTAQADVKVQVYAPNGQLLVEGTSDAQGLTTLALPRATQSLLVTAQTAEDMSFLTLSQRASNTCDFLKAGQCEAFILTDRGIYRHGDTIFMQAILRNHLQQAPPQLPVVLRLLQSGQEIATQNLRTDQYGAVNAEVTIPDFWRSGACTLQVSLPGKNAATLGTQQVRIESFVPPQIRATVKELATTNTTLTCLVEAQHLFGAPAQFLSLAASVAIQAVDFMPKGWDDWIFGDQEKSVAWRRIHAERQNLDAQGQARFTFDLGKLEQPAAALKATVETSVLEASGRAISARREHLIHPYPFYLGILPANKTAIITAQTNTLRLVTVAPDGTPLKNPTNLRIKLEKKEWLNSFKYTENGDFTWHTEYIKSPIIDEQPVDGHQWQFEVPLAGDYLVTVRDPQSGASTSWNFHAHHPGQNAATWNHQSSETLDLRLDQETYQPGDKARLQIRAPFSGLAWITLQRHEIIHSQLLAMTNNTAEIEWQVGDWMPNVEISVSLIRPATIAANWGAHRASGTIALPVQLPEHQLQVTVTPPAATVLPNSQVPIQVKVRTHQGAPVTNACVTLLAIDEAICGLTDYQTPQPAPWFARARVSGLIYSDLYRALMRPVDHSVWGANSHTAGDMDSEMLKRLNPIAARRFKPVALYHTQLTTDRHGNLTCPLSLPEFAGELRLMAIAWTANATGSHADKLLVKRQVVVQPDFPRILAPNDRAQGVVALYNEQVPATHATVVVKAYAEEPLALNLEQTVELGPGASQLLPLTLEALPTIGTGLIHVTVTGGDRQPYHDTFELAVRPAAPLHQMVESVIIPGGETRHYSAATNLMPATVQQHLVLATAPAIELITAYEYLRTYPYGCLEQTVARAFPLLALSPLGVSLPTEHSTIGAEAPAQIKAAITRIRSMRQSYGYAMWPNLPYGNVDMFATLFTAHFLVEAKKTGYDVTDSELTHILACIDRAYNPGEDHVVYAQFVLALAKKPVMSKLHALFEQRATLKTEELLLLARALAYSGEAHNARLVMALVPTVHDLRQAAFGLLAALEITPNNTHFILECFQKIQSERRYNNHWGTTQNNALALLALGRWQLQQPPSTTKNIHAHLQGTQLVEVAHTNLFSYTIEHGGDLKVTNRSRDQLYLTRHTHGVPLQPLPARNQGITVERTWLNLEGDEVASDTLKRGDFLVVKLSVNVGQEKIDDLIIEDLLPACLEIEGSDLRTGVLPWLAKPQEYENWVLHKEARDDRLLLFSKQCKGEHEYYYGARVVSAGTFSVPAVTASRMYNPNVMGRTAASRVEVSPE